MLPNKKKILFITGTRADFGKLKKLIETVRDDEELEYKIFATGMHLLAKYGNTVNEIHRSGFKNVFMYQNQVANDEMDTILANTIHGLSRYLHENPVDLIVVHGDRVEALAGAAVGALRNTLVAHVEGGEISGTIDELIRHAVSKLSHVHYVATETAKRRLIQLGECERSVFNIGSPDVDVLLSNTLPSLHESKERYSIPYDEFFLAMLHPVTTEAEEKKIADAQIFVNALIKSKRNFVVIFPNNDSGSHHILTAYQLLEKRENFRIFPSLRFEHFVVLLKHAQGLIGNSSAGVHEAPIFGTPTINIGTRQNNRYQGKSVTNIPFEEIAILEAIEKINGRRFTPDLHYGQGNSANEFAKTLRKSVWEINIQKQFKDTA